MFIRQRSAPQRSGILFLYQDLQDFQRITLTIFRLPLSFGYSRYRKKKHQGHKLSVNHIKMMHNHVTLIGINTLKFGTDSIFRNQVLHLI